MIVCIGDSITTGQGLGPSEPAWPRLLNGHAVIARGRPGDTTRLALERFPEDLQSLTPDAVIIQFGHNDANRWATDRGMPRVSERAFAANLTEMIERCRAFGAVPLLCTLTPSHRSERHAADTARYDAIIREVATAEHVALIDVRCAFDDRADLLAADGIHLSAAGHRVYAEQVMATLREAL